MKKGQESKESALSPARFALAAAMAAAASYMLALKSGFVFDERILIQGNPAVSGFDLASIVLHKFWPGPISGVYYRPVTVLSYALCYALAGDTPWIYHAFNVLVHAAVSALLVFLAWRMFNLHKAALAAGLVFALHPAHLESVAWVPGRTDVLAALFMLASWLLILGARERSGKRRHISYALSMAAFIMALGAKESAAVLPLLVMASDFFIGRDSRAHWREYVAMFALLAGWLVMRSVALSGPGEPPAPDPLAALGLPALLLHIFAMPAYALFVIMFPLPWRIDFAHQDTLLSMTAWETAGLCAVTAALVIAAVLWRRRAPLASFCAAGFLLSMIPMSHIVPFPTLFAQRFLYIPGLFFALFIGLLARRLAAEKLSLGLRELVFLALAAVMAFSTIVNSRKFTSDLSFWKSAVHEAPENAVARNWLGIALKEHGMLERAASQYRAAQRLDPGLYVARMNLAEVHLEQGETGQAVRILSSLAKEHPSDARIFFNLGSAYAAEGRWERAKDSWHRALELDPGNFNAHMALGRCYLDIEKDPVTALQHAKAAGKIMPRNKEAAGLAERARRALGVRAKP